MDNIGSLRSGDPEFIIRVSNDLRNVSRLFPRYFEVTFDSELVADGDNEPGNSADLAGLWVHITPNLLPTAILVVARRI
jgi:hypothetical protein